MLKEGFYGIMDMAQMGEVAAEEDGKEGGQGEEMAGSAGVVCDGDRFVDVGMQCWCWCWWWWWGWWW